MLLKSNATNHQRRSQADSHVGLRAYIKVPDPSNMTPEGLQINTTILTDVVDPAGQTVVWKTNDQLIIEKRTDFPLPQVAAYKVQYAVASGTGRLACYEVKVEGAVR